jgi:hypothetical protein
MRGGPGFQFVIRESQFFTLLQQNAIVYTLQLPVQISQLQLQALLLALRCTQVI